MGKKRGFKYKLSVMLNDNLFINKKAITIKKSLDEVNGILGTKHKK